MYRFICKISIPVCGYATKSDVVINLWGLSPDEDELQHFVIELLFHEDLERFILNALPRKEYHSGFFWEDILNRVFVDLENHLTQGGVKP